MQISITKNQFNLIANHSGVVKAAEAELRATQFALHRAQQAYDAASSAFTAVVTCLSLDADGGACDVGATVQISEKDGRFILTIQSPLAEANAAAGASNA